MARIFIDGSEGGKPDLWDGESGATVVSSAGLDMDGDYCLDLNFTTEYVRKDITATDEMYFAFLYRPTNVNSRGMLSLYNGSTLMVQIRRETVTKIEAYRGTTLIDSGTIGMNLYTTYFIEVRVKIDDSNGRIQIKVNGVSDIDFTGDTKDSTDSQFDNIRLGWNDVVYVHAYFDNFIMDDAAWIGKTYIQALVPIGAGNSTGWTPSVGNNWECVDEKPPNDADYNNINSNDVTDTFATGNMVGTIGSVKCVQVQARANYVDSPTPTKLKLVSRSGGTDYLSADKTVPLNPASLWNLWEDNPADSQAWEEADVNAMEIGYRSVA